MFVSSRKGGKRVSVRGGKKDQVIPLTKPWPHPSPPNLLPSSKIRIEDK